ncbi:MAG: hypothetical protein DWB56_14875 [Candidatus Jettenia sp.]|uniref:Hypothetical phage protein n=1 Tax=Candidatus Jettenia caeni TaxID=247490 RepID=I3ILR1_9BACT|nr:hypothetical protein [Candidatus Jettenia sp. AMX1]KAA0243572.1 MAG: hypothetical protein EDM70_09970 [Candidatus Brocadia sp. AMX2]MBC6930216.1 hypothetical protein [Candidatus Jettenia sp.]GAB62656.1 hypothetical phage protein [Candidatus Jettenia caeni]MCQ3927090.1 hypothetical protein [Candidatus Jettenia sp.]MDL1939886.1 hypothetical protein [Candidatus Jettenia sp. AMX1]
MPPNVRELIVAGPLANVSIAYRNKSYIGDRVFPVIPNVSPKAKIARYQKGAWFRDEAVIRGPGSRAGRGGYPVDYLSISTVEYAFAKEVTDEDRRFSGNPAMGEPPLKPDQDAIEFCSEKIDLKKERIIASKILTTTWSGVSGGEDAGGLWAAGSGNTFLADVRARVETIRSNTGLKPNVLMMDFGTYNSLKEEATVLDKIKYTERGVLTKELLAAILELDEVIIGEAIYSTAKEKKDGTDFTASNIWEKNAGKGAGFLFHRPSAPGLKTPSAGYQARVNYENGQPRRTTTWRENAEHQDVYEVAEECDIVVTGADLGFLWVDTLLT